MVDQLQQTIARRPSATCLKEEGVLTHEILYDPVWHPPQHPRPKQSSSHRVMCTFQESSPIIDCGAADQPARDTRTAGARWEILPLRGKDTQILPFLRAIPQCHVQPVRGMKVSSCTLESYKGEGDAHSRSRFDWIQLVQADAREST